MLALWQAVGAQAAVTPFVPPKTNRQSDRVIQTSSASYAVQVGGTLDEFNTAFYPVTPVGYARLDSKFQPNRYLMIENVGTTRIDHPRVTLNGRRDWSSVSSILNGILAPGMTDAEKAKAIFYHTADLGIQTHDNNTRVGPELPGPYDPSSNEFRELADPVKATNTYYSNGCSTAAANFAILSQHAGLDARVVWLSPTDRYQTHSVAEVFYEGDWHVFDPDSRAYFLDDDEQTVASYETLHNKPWLVQRTHAGGFASPGLKLDFAQEYAKYWPPRQMPINADWTSTLELSLRPNEKFIWRWDDEGKFRWGDNPRNRGIEPPQLANGKLIFKPALDELARSADAAFEEGVRAGRSNRTGGVILTPNARQQLGSIVYEIESPYPIVGGIIGGEFQKTLASDLVRLSISTDGEQWQPVLSAQPGRHESYAAIDSFLRPGAANAIYRYFVKAEMMGTSALLPEVAGLYFETDVQMARPALPSLSVGHNEVSVQTDSTGPQRLRVVHAWEEGSANTPPPAPTQLEIRGGVDSLILNWKQSPDANREPIVDYHVQVSDDPDMRFPLATNFDRLSFSGNSQWPVPAGWFRPFEDYFFRVRGRDRWGAWSEWSSPLALTFDPYASRDGKRVIGDANLDGKFSSADLVRVFQNGEYEDRIVGNSTWTEGDWNGDLEFNSSDFVLLHGSGQFVPANQLRAMAVPEATPLSVGWVVVLAFRRCRARRCSRPTLACAADRRVGA